MIYPATTQKINEKDEFPLYLYQKTSASNSLLSSFNLFGSNTPNINQLSLEPVIECEFHESSNVDENDKDITGVWIRTNANDRKTYKSIDKIKTIHYIDDVNPVQLSKKESDWILVDSEDDADSKTQSIDDLTEEINELRLQRSNSLSLIDDLKSKNRKLSDELQQNISNKENDALVAEHKKFRKYIHCTTQTDSSSNTQSLGGETERN